MEPHAFACETRRARNALHVPRSALHARLLTKHAAPRYARELADFASPHFNNRSTGPALVAPFAIVRRTRFGSALTRARAGARRASAVAGRSDRSAASSRTVLSAPSAVIERAAKRRQHEWRSSNAQRMI